MSVKSTVLSGLCMILAVLAVIFFIQYKRNIRAAYGRLEAFNPSSVHTSYGNVSYVESGKGQPIVVFHGICGGYDQGISMKYMFEPGCRVIAPSRFGYPGSDLPANAAPKDQAKAYKEFLDALGIDKVVVLGHSAGGGPALRFAMQYPERTKGLILLSANVPYKPGNKVVSSPPAFTYNDFPMWLMTTFGKAFFFSMLGVDKADLGSVPKETKDSFMEFFQVVLPLKPRRAGILNDNRITNPDVTLNFKEYPLESVKVPVLILQSKDDPMAKYEFVRDAHTRLPQSKMIAFDKGGHPNFGHDDEMKKAVGEFLREL